MVNLWIASILVQIAIAIHLNKRLSPTSAIVLSAWYIIFLELLFLLANNGLLDDYLTGAETRGHLFTPENTFAVYTILFFTIFASSIGIQREKEQRLISSNQTNWIRQAAGNWWIIAFAWLVGLANISFIRWEIALQNNEYLLMNSPDAYLSTPAISTLLRAALGFTGILGAFCLPLLFRNATLVKFLLLLPPWLFVVLYQTAAHSRTAAIYCFVFFATAYIFSKRRKSLIVISGSISTLFLTMFAIEMRGEQSHGLLPLAENLIDFTESWRIDSLLKVMVNLGQGIFATSDALAIQADHDLKYKILSFSPLISKIDGFDEVLACCEIRVHSFVPMSAVAEAIHFGPIYSAIALLTMALAWRKSSQVFNQRGASLLAAFLNLFIFLSFIMANAYPMRNSFRQILFALIACYAIEAIRRKSRKTRNSATQQTKMQTIEQIER